MGLLSKAAAGSFSSNEAEKSVSEGGLLKLITQKQVEGTRTSTAAIPVEKNVVPSSPTEKAVMEKLSAGHAKFGAFQGVILETLKYPAEEFLDRLTSMVSDFGTVQTLVPGRCLVLFGSEQDRELIGQHLAKTVSGKSIFHFQAENPREAFTLLKPYI